MEPHYLVVYFFCGVNLLNWVQNESALVYDYKIVTMCHL